MRALFILASTAIVTGCVVVPPDYAYFPTAKTLQEDAPGDLDGHAAASYPIPADHPRGEVSVAALRIGDVKLPSNPKGRRVATFAVRMVVHNADQELWTIDTAYTTGILEGGRREPPLFSTVDGQPMEMVVLMPCDTRTVDLYYELPAERAKKAAKSASFGVDWRVETPERVIARGATWFERHDGLRPRPVPPTPQQMTKKLEESDDGMAPPLGRAEAPGWSTPHN